jgi:hypothetical protein
MQASVAHNAQLPEQLVLQAGLNQPATGVCGKTQLTCKDSLLVGWGEATDQPGGSEVLGVVHVDAPGTAATFDGCTLQYHPDSKHIPMGLIQPGGGKDYSADTITLVAAKLFSHVALLNCQLVGPSHRGAESTGMGV